MADNYLENKMEEHRRGNTGVKHVLHRTPSGAMAGSINLPFPSRRVLLISHGDISSDSVSRSVLRALSASGCSVAFTGDSFRSGQLTAQTDGGQFHLVGIGDTAALDRTISYITSKRGPVEIIVECGDPVLYNHAIRTASPASDCLKIRIGNVKSSDIKPDETAIIPATDIAPDVFANAAARITVYLALPDSAMLRGITVRINPDGSAVMV